MAFSGRLSDAQWARIAPHLPRRKPNPRGGRPLADPRKCLEGILWIQELSGFVDIQARRLFEGHPE